jgi:uncharacterized protein (DUF1778 family)
MPAIRDRRLSILISDEEHGMLDELADAEGVTVSTFVRQFTRRAHQERFPKQAAKKTAHARGGK